MKTKEKTPNQLIADFMGFNYRDETYMFGNSTLGTIPISQKQKMKPDGTPFITSIYRDDSAYNTGKRRVEIDVWIDWNPQKDWNDLMPIVENIEKMGYSVSISNQNTDIWSVHSDSHVTKVRGAFGKLYSKNVAPEGISLDHKEMSKLETAYTAVVDFITWYKNLSK